MPFLISCPHKRGKDYLWETLPQPAFQFTRLFLPDSFFFPSITHYSLHQILILLTRSYLFTRFSFSLPDFIFFYTRFFSLPEFISFYQIFSLYLIFFLLTRFSFSLKDFPSLYLILFLFTRFSFSLPDFLSLYQFSFSLPDFLSLNQFSFPLPDFLSLYQDPFPFTSNFHSPLSLYQALFLFNLLPFLN